MTEWRVCLIGILCTPFFVGACRGDAGTGPGGGGLDLLWVSAPTSAGNDWVDGTPAIDGGRLFVQEANRLVALDAASGARLWSRQIRIAPSPGPTTLRAADGVVFVSETDSMMAVNAATGATIWTVHPDSQTVTAPALDNTTFYTGQRGIPVVYALARTDGSIRWKVNVGTGYTFLAHVRGVAVSGDTVYAAVERYLNVNGAAASGVLVALAAADGRELWRYETPGTKDFFYGPPVPAGRMILVNDFYAGDVAAIDVVTHQEVWRTAVGGTIGIRLVGQTLFTASSDTKARALDLGTGRIQWSQDTGSSGFGLGVCGNNLYVSAFHVRRYDGATGEITGEASVGTSNGGFVTHPVSDGTRIFVAGTSGVAAFAC